MRTRNGRTHAYAVMNPYTGPLAESRKRAISTFAEAVRQCKSEMSAPDRLAWWQERYLQYIRAARKHVAAPMPSSSAQLPTSSIPLSVASSSPPSLLNSALKSSASAPYIHVRLSFVYCPGIECRFPLCSHTCEHDMPSRHYPCPASVPISAPPLAVLAERRYIGSHSEQDHRILRRLKTALSSALSPKIVNFWGLIKKNRRFSCKCRFFFVSL